MLATTPLAERLRPQSIDEYVGQSHLVGSNGPIRRMIENKSLPSILLWGPPGVGKTTLVSLIANTLKRKSVTLSAISAGVKDVREVIENAKIQGNTILFIDEIHRFNKAQQDALLNAVERGFITLIGATTENPSFEVIPALLSRCQVYILKALSEDDLISLLNRAAEQDAIIAATKPIIQETEALLQLSGGDARKLLNLFELVSMQAQGEPITNTLVMEVAQQKLVMYDKNGEQHYDIISAFIKSIRGSDPNAAIYWLAVMLEAGEDIKFIARRLLILAAEDIGNANPTALVIANECFQAVNVIGIPEAEIVLAQAVTYLAASAKSNASYSAIKRARAFVKQNGAGAVPLHLRNAPTKLMKNLGYGKQYQYAHDFEGNFVHQEYFPDGLENTLFYVPGNNPRENEMRAKLHQNWKGKYGY